MEKKVFLLFNLLTLFILFTNQVWGQKSIDNIVKKLSNKELKYEIIKVGVTTLKNNKLNLPRMQVNIESLDIESLQEQVNHRKLMKKLISSLSDTTRDWYANLLLYAITKKDATSLLGIETRVNWINSLTKKNDVLYWEKYSSTMH